MRGHKERGRDGEHTEETGASGTRKAQQRERSGGESAACSNVWGMLSSLFKFDANFILPTDSTFCWKWDFEYEEGGISEKHREEDESNQNRANDTERALSQQQGQNLYS